FFCQAEDGIRDPLVTGVQTCALPISPSKGEPAVLGGHLDPDSVSGCLWATGITRVDCSSTLNKHDFALSSRPGLVLDSSRDNEQFSGSEVNLAIPEVDLHLPTDDDEDFVGVSVTVPDKLALN